MKNKRIISIFNEDNEFLIYFDGTTCKNEDYYGNQIETENKVYLDKNLNTFVLNATKKTANEILLGFLEKGIPAFVGPHSPEIEGIKEVKLPNGKKIMQEVMIPNEDPKTVGIWRLSTKEEKSHYIRLLEKQCEERMYFKLY